MTPCPTCNIPLPDSMDTCPKCGETHTLLKSGIGQVLARVSYSPPGFGQTNPPTDGDDDAEPELEHEIVAEPVVAYRIWEIDNDYKIEFTPDDIRMWARAWDEGRNPFSGLSAPYLGGVGVDSLWSRPVMHATCTPPSSGPDDSWHVECPHPKCTCGIWGLKDEQHIGRVLAKYQNAKCAWGTVRLWGTIIETERGYRAEYAQPLSISAYGISQEEAAELAEVYECEVTVVDELPITTEYQDTLAMQTLAMQQAITSLRQTFGTAMAPTAAAAAQQISALSTAMPSMIIPHPNLVSDPPKKRLLRRIGDRIFLSSWLFVGMALANWALWFFSEAGTFNLISALLCFVAAIVLSQRLRKLAKFAVLVLPFGITLFAWAAMMMTAALLDWLLETKKDEYGDGPAERWVWKHDPVKWFDGRL